MRLALILGAVALVCASGEGRAQSVLAECGASSGYAYYLAPGNQGWQDDRISSGRFRFTVDAAGNPNLLFIDASGGVIDAAADGGRLSFSRRDVRRGEFGVVVIYPATGVVETYNVYNIPDGTRRLLWTSNKPRIGEIELSKAGAYTATCE